MQTKVDQLVNVIRQRVAAAAPGQRIGSVEDLQWSVPDGASIGGVIAAVKRAQAENVPVAARRGRDGGYFRAEEGEEIGAEPFSGVLQLALEARQALDRLIAELETAAV